ncbi:hypothetical protein X739_00720 [Mesorhizobium sp. LNHC220B00]|nr:hypothetical protein X739_00720 [Mesorhizobium sp. LNHC220B00]
MSKGICAVAGEYCERLGLDRKLIADRIRLGWTLERAIAEPNLNKRSNGVRVPTEERTVA